MHVPYVSRAGCTMVLLSAKHCNSPAFQEASVDCFHQEAELSFMWIVDFFLNPKGFMDETFCFTRIVFSMTACFYLHLF